MTVTIDNEIVELSPEQAEQIIREHRQFKAQVQEDACHTALLEAQIALLLQQIRLLRHRRFGTSSEKSDPAQEAIAFNEAEVSADPDAPEPETVVVVRRKKNKGGQRRLDLCALDTEEITYDLPVEEQVCPQCSGALHQMGEEIREELKLVPAHLVRVLHIRAKYACRHCQKEEERTPILTAPMPAVAFPGSLASPSVVAYIMSQKFVEASPLYRQEQYFHRQGIALSRQSMANWTLAGAGWLEPIYAAMKSHLLAGDIVHADETRVQVIREPGRKATTDSTMWLYRTGRDGPPIALFDYQTSRAAEHAVSFLSGYSGYLNVDGWAAYEQVPDVVLAGCMAHARRHFHEAMMVLPEAARKKTNTAERVGLDYCNRLYAIEAELKACSAEERKAARLERSKPVLDEFRVWLDKSTKTVSQKSKIGQAISYCRSQWKKLATFLLDGRLDIDNNRAERTIKPFVIGRKNWLFANTPRGARASAVIYSVVETAKENGLDPHRYLAFLFERLPGIDTNDTDAVLALLPWSAAAQNAAAVPSNSAPAPQPV